jgi:hypothetical protein
MTHYSIHLPAKAFIVRYVQTIYGSGNTHVFLDPETDFGDIVFTKMASNIHCHLKPSDMGSRLTRLNDHLVLKIPMHWMRKLPTKDLNTHQIIKINRHLENIFERDFCDVVSRAHTILVLTGRQPLNVSATTTAFNWKLTSRLKH